GGAGGRGNAAAHVVEAVPTVDVPQRVLELLSQPPQAGDLPELSELRPGVEREGSAQRLVELAGRGPELRELAGALEREGEAVKVEICPARRRDPSNGLLRLQEAQLDLGPPRRAERRRVEPGGEHLPAELAMPLVVAEAGRPDHSALPSASAAI